MTSSGSPPAAARSAWATVVPAGAAAVGGPVARRDEHGRRDGTGVVVARPMLCAARFLTGPGSPPAAARSAWATVVTS
ncbi:hypothetical protein ACH4TV_43410, partial [Streptomyces sp. NPDC020898]|uniref:hypothetical protein n=1 Tax=Streptomyces sp. NPDC020898 TaxID=3365101 RepID=UPI0037AC1F13